MIALIYTLSYGANVFYVGATIRSLEERLKEHIGDCKSGTSYPVYKYMRENNSSPEINLIDTVEVASKKELSLIERYWVSQMSSYGHVLKNISFNVNLKRSHKDDFEPTSARGLRLPNGMWDDLEKLRKKARRKLNEYIAIVLEDHIKKEKSR